MKVFILGGTGFIGTHATHALIEKGHQVSTLALPPAPTEGRLPVEVSVTLGDFNQLSDEEVAALMQGCQGAIFAGGVDDRVTPRAPAYPFFHQMNVLPTARFFRLAVQAGVERGVLLSSYFAHFARIWPELALAEHHPYIRSRIEQEAAALDAAGSQLDLSILQLPYIFGSSPGSVPLWKPILDYLHWPLPWVFYMQGGSAMVAVESVAGAVVGALEKGQNGERYLVGDENLTWTEWLKRLMAMMGQDKPIVTLPGWLIRVGLWGLAGWHRLRGLEGGLDPVHFLDLQTRRTFFDPHPAQQALDFSGGILDQAFQETLRACGFTIK